MRKFDIPAALKGAALPPNESARTPDKIRQAMSKLALLESGGKRVSVNLTGQAVKDLERIKSRDGTDNTQSISAAIAAFTKTK
jgi:hypothetical protein